MVDVFISYPRSARAKVEPIKAKLDTLGLDCFFDLENIEGGANFPDTIDRALRTSKAVLCCWSPIYFERPWCMIECRDGLAREIMVPVSLERFGRFDPPADMRHLNYLDLTTWDGGDAHEDWNRTLHAIGKLVGRELASPLKKTLFGLKAEGSAPAAPEAVQARADILSDLRATWAAFPAKENDVAVEKFLTRVRAAAPGSGLEFEVEHHFDELALRARATPIDKQLRAYNLARAAEYVERVGSASDLSAVFGTALKKRTPASAQDDAVVRFQEMHWSAQRSFVDVSEVANPQAARVHILSEVRSDRHSRDPEGLWVVGAAGTGKTTVLHRVYFELIADSLLDPTAPIPMLIEPRNLSSVEDVEVLARQAEPLSLFRAALSIWTNRRGLTGPEQPRNDALFQLIIAGKVIVLLDGHDELARLKFESTLVSALRVLRADYPVRYLVCSRPEIVDAEPLYNDTVVRLAPNWNVADAIKYVHGRLGKAATSTDELEKFLVKNQSAAWLRNPRCLDLFAGLIARDPTAAAKLLGGVRVGEYQLLELVAKDALRRLQRSVDSNISARSVVDFLGEMARNCAQRGVYEPDPEDSRWTALRGVEELIVVHRAAIPTASFVNPNFLDFFQAGPIAETLLANEVVDAAYHYKWSDSLIDYVAVLLQGQPSKLADRSLYRALGKFRLGSDFADRQKLLDAPQGFIGGNLLEVKARLTKLADQDGKLSANTGWGDLTNLHLAGANLRDLTFLDCDFQGSVLHRADLRSARFIHCKFEQVNFAGADATGAYFEGCAFDFASGDASQSSSRVHQMIVEGVEARQCGDYVLDTFVKFGARRFTSRYRGRFQKVFAERSELFLGPGAVTATAAYVDAIRRALLGRSDADRVTLVDLMAGGSNPALRSVLLDPQFSRLSVVAVDRDTTQLLDLKREFEAVGEAHPNASSVRRFYAYQEEITDGLKLAPIFREVYLQDPPRHADIIIGKKALHEIPRAHQPAVLRECVEMLGVDGALVLFVDAPFTMTPEAFARLEAARSQLSRAHKILSQSTKLDERNTAIEQLRRVLITDLKFAPTPSDHSLFANLWVMLKDWANDNVREFSNRYFSSADEVTDWVLETGDSLGAVRCLGRTDNHYMLFTSCFNEAGMKRVFDYQQTLGVRPADDALLRSLWQADDRYFFFEEFARAHLWDGAKPSEFGDFAGAVVQEVDLSQIDIAFAEFSEMDVGFRFPISVVVFEKGEGDNAL